MPIEISQQPLKENIGTKLKSGQQNFVYKSDRYSNIKVRDVRVNESSNISFKNKQNIFRTPSWNVPSFNFD